MRQLTSLHHLLLAVVNREPLNVLWAALRGKTRPMTPAQKRATLLHYSKRYRTTQFLETGTYFGDILDYLSPYYLRLSSIELSPELFRKASERFAHNPKISLYQGDSAAVLPGLLDRLDGRTLIWLNAHYSDDVTARAAEETPILVELRQIFACNVARHIILIDAAREFGSNPAYPPLDVVARIAREVSYRFECRFDIIRLTPSAR